MKEERCPAVYRQSVCERAAREHFLGAEKMQGRPGSAGVGVVVLLSMLRTRAGGEMELMGLGADAASRQSYACCLARARKRRADCPAQAC